MDVVRKDGLLLVRELAAEVKNHMDFKINAVMVSDIFLTSYLKYITANENTFSLIKFTCENVQKFQNKKLLTEVTFRSYFAELIS